MKSSIEPLRSPSTGTSGTHGQALRLDRLDALRALAMLWMAAFHFGFDLNHFGHIHPRQSFFTDPFWTWQRTCIVSTFLFCAGAGQALALHAGQGWPRFWRRWAQVAGCAVLVSLGSAWMFPRSWIFFGVLHGMAVMLIVARCAAPLGRWLWPLGCVLVLLPQGVALPAFDAPALQWLGLGTHKPITEDWVPITPWLGVMLWGLAAGQWAVQRRPGWLLAPLSPRAAWLAVLGRYSLSFYMLHQPGLIGALLAWQALGRV